MTQMKATATGLLSDVPRRLLTICIGIPVLWCLWSFSRTRQAFFQGDHVLMCWEWTSLSSIQQSQHRFAFVASSVILANIHDDGLFVVCFMVSAAAFSIACAPSQGDVVAAKKMLSSLAGLLLVTLPNRYWITSVSHDFHDTVSLLLTVWNADTGALVAGRLGTWMGTQCPRPQWLRNISPAKSTEGLLGGLLGGVGTYVCLPWFWAWIHSLNLAPSSLEEEGQRLWQKESPTTLQRLLTEGLILSVCAVLGDLWESSLKRAFQVKDSGKLLPGHGGVLDRFDSSLLAVIVYHYNIVRTRR